MQVQRELYCIHIRMIFEWEDILFIPVRRKRNHSITGKQVFQFPLILVDQGSISVSQDLTTNIAYKTP
jgi:hypothetical protein